VNIQGRLRHGTLVPFEINPRFSASTYLRAMAGFNEVDLLLRNAALGEDAPTWKLREGWYLRSLTERFIAPDELKS
jgi:carbamoyl-phosphate synthase large subunit